MVISFSKFKNGCGGATGGTVSGITLWSADYTREYIDSVVSGYTKTEDFATINGSAITEGGNLVIQGGSGGTEYYAGTNIDITNNVISVTGLSTINGSAITSGDNLIIEGTSYSGGTGIGVENHIISVTGDYETVVELTQAEYDALTAYSENTTYIITDAPAINMSAYTPTSGFSTINGSAITTGDAIVIETGGNYSAGTNIDITNDVISVTGITVPTKTSDLVNDSGFITSSDIPTSNTAFTNDAGYVNSGEVETQIASKDYPTKNWVQGHVTLAISGKLDTNIFTAYTANTQTEIDGKQDASAMTQYATTAFTESTYLKEHQSLSNYYTKAEINQGILNIESQIAEKADSSAVTEQITQEIADALVDYATIQDIPTNLSELNNDAGYITSADIPTIPTNVSELNNDMGFVDSGEVETQIQTALEGVATEQYVDDSVNTLVMGIASIGMVNDVTTSGRTVTIKKTGLEGGTPTTSTTSFDVVIPQDITDAVTSAIAAETARTESTYLKEHQSLSAYSTTEQVSTLINTAKQEVESEIPDVSDFVTSAQVETQITSKGYITGYTETDPVFMASPASGITANDITNWNGKQPAGDYALKSELPTVPTSNTAFTNDAGYITDAALNGYATTAFTEQTYLKEHQSLSAYTPTSGFATINGSAITEGGNIVIQGGSSIVNYQPLQVEFDPYYSYFNVYEISSVGTPQFYKRIAFDTINGNSIIHPSDNDKVDWTIPTSTSALTNDSGFITSAFTESTYEKLTNKVTSISSASTDTQYPSAKCVYDIIGDIETLLASI